MTTPDGTIQVQLDHIQQVDVPSDGRIYLDHIEPNQFVDLAILDTDGTIQQVLETQADSRGRIQLGQGRHGNQTRTIAHIHDQVPDLHTRMTLDRTQERG